MLEDALELLGDAVARTVLGELAERPPSAPEVTERCEHSRVTVYRRIADLDAAGLVRTEMELSASGHHRWVYHNVLEELTVSVCPDGLEGNETVGQPP